MRCSCGSERGRGALPATRSSVRGPVACCALSGSDARAAARRPHGPASSRRPASVRVSGRRGRTHSRLSPPRHGLRGEQRLQEEAPGGRAGAARFHAASTLASRRFSLCIRGKGASTSRPFPEASSRGETRGRLPANAQLHPSAGPRPGTPRRTRRTTRQTSRPVPDGAARKRSCVLNSRPGHLNEPEDRLPGSSSKEEACETSRALGFYLCWGPVHGRPRLSPQPQAGYRLPTGGRVAPSVSTASLPGARPGP